MVEAEAQLEQQVAFQDPGGHPLVVGGGSHGSEEDRVVAAQPLHGVVVEHLARGQPVLRAERVLRPLQGDPGGLRHGVEHLDRLGHHLRTDPVAGEDSDRVAASGLGGSGFAHAPTLGACRR